MPLSFLTRLRGVIIVAMFAFALLWLEISDQMWAWVTSLFLLPLLIWLLVSNAVKDAPPFDDTAFHRTRPVTAGQVYRHLVGFHLLVLGGILLVVIAYVWRFNLGWREALYGTFAVAIPLIAIGSLFGVTASLWTSTKHWKGWPFIMLLLIPAVSLFAFVASMIGEAKNIPIAALTFAGALIYPALWWLVAARRRWLLGIVLGLSAGILMPWLSLSLGVLDKLLRSTRLVQVPEPERTPALVFRRLKNPASEEEMGNDPSATSHPIEVLGLGPDEFIRVNRMEIGSLDPQGRTLLPKTVSTAWGLTYENFSTSKNGLQIPATASLLHAIGNGTAAMPWWDNFPKDNRERTLESRLRLPTGSYSGAWKENRPPSPKTGSRAWEVGGQSFRWLKVLDVPATNGGRAKLPDTGTLRMLPLEETSGDFSLTLRITGSGWIGPVVVARTSDGQARFLDLQVSGNSQNGFLTNETELQLRNETAESPGVERLRILRNSRIEVYWAQSRGTFSAILPPPE